MRTEYYTVYERLFADYAYDFPRRRYPGELYRDIEYQLIRSTRRSIDRAEYSELLRPDGKYFLLVNFHQLIIVPLLEGDDMGIRDLPPIGPGLQNDIDFDLASIIRAAQDDRRRGNDGQISGHEIMRAIDGIWLQLRTTKFETWG